ncbi:STE3-domain-containing protein [Panus rudis PR-1116 ss-1]|nr:STE3-domain-containing protein [Panus rudis PR-1116 ss-1]
MPRAELPVLSFFCFSVLFILTPIHWQSKNVAILSLLSWLGISNIIQGVDSVVWFRDTSLDGRGWCDFATKFRLATQLALPAVSCCICWNLLRLSCPSDGFRRHRKALREACICVLFPLIYALLHLIVQNHRFTIVPSFGCSLSTYTSIPAIILVWLPPIILSTVSYVLAILAALKYFSRTHCESISLSNILAFVRPLVMAIMISSVAISTTSFSLFYHITAEDILPWHGLSATHSHLSEIIVLSSDVSPDLKWVEVEWWAIPASSAIFILASSLGFILNHHDDVGGQGSVKKWVSERILGRSTGMSSFIESSKEIPAHIIFRAPSTPTLSSPSPTSISSVKAAQIYSSPQPPSPSPSSSGSESDSDPDTSFALSTLNYVGSPTGRMALNLPPPPQPSRNERDAANEVSTKSNRLSVPAQEPISGSPASIANSILSAPWPEPPSTIPLSPNSSSTVSIPSPKSTYSQQSSRSARGRPPSIISVNDSIVSSTLSSAAYIYDPALPPVEPPDRRPFENSGIPAIQPPKHARRMKSKESLTGRHIGLSLRRGDRQLRDGVFMTVVQETV